MHLDDSSAETRQYSLQPIRIVPEQPAISPQSRKGRQVFIVFIFALLAALRLICLYFIFWRIRKIRCNRTVETTRILDRVASVVLEY